MSQTFLDVVIFLAAIIVLAVQFHYIILTFCNVAFFSFHFGTGSKLSFSSYWSLSSSSSSATFYRRSFLQLLHGLYLLRCLLLLLNLFFLLIIILFSLSFSSLANTFHSYTFFPFFFFSSFLLICLSLILIILFLFFLLFKLFAYDEYIFLLLSLLRFLSKRLFTKINEQSLIAGNANLCNKCSMHIQLISIGIFKKRAGWAWLGPSSQGLQINEFVN